MIVGVSSLFIAAAIILGIPLAFTAGIVFKRFPIVAGVIIAAYLTLWTLVTVVERLWGAPLDPDTLLYTTPERFVRDSLTMTGRVLTGALLSASLGSLIAALPSKTRPGLIVCYVVVEVVLRTVFPGSIATDFSLSGLLIGLLSRYPEHSWQLYVGATLLVAVLLQVGRYMVAHMRAAGTESRTIQGAAVGSDSRASGNDGR